MIATLFSLFFDKNLKPYWLSKALGAALALIFGIILKSFGYNNSTILISLCLLYLSQGVAFLALDALSVGLRAFVSYVFCLISLGLSLYMFFKGINILFLCAIAVLLQHAIRENSNNGVSYIREKGNWPLGVDVATILANEAGRGVGILLIGLISVAMAMNGDWLFAILALFSLAIIIYHPSPRGHFGTHGNSYSSSKGFNLDALGRKLVMLSSIHNGVIFGFQAFLGLALYDLIQSASDNGNTSGKIGVMLSMAIVIGMVAYAYFKKKTDGIPEQVSSASMLPLSILCMTTITGLAFFAIALWQFEIITPAQTSLAVVIMMGLMISFGSLYNIGFLQLVDLSYRNLDFYDRINRRKSIMNINTMASRFIPALSIFMIYLASLKFEELSSLSFFVAGFVFVLEAILLYHFYRLSLREKVRLSRMV